MTKFGQVPLWLLSGCRGLGASGSTTNPPQYGEYLFVPKAQEGRGILHGTVIIKLQGFKTCLQEVESFQISFDSELPQEPVAVVQLADLADPRLLSSLLQYVTYQYTPAPSRNSSGLELRASMYTSMLQRD